MKAVRRRSGIGMLLAVTVVSLTAVAGAVAAGLTIAHYAYGWDWGAIPTPVSKDDPTILEPLKIGLTIAAGLGGAVALVVAYRRQRATERQEPRDQYVSAVAQLGADDATTRLAGVYALANLADSWPQQRQQCVDVLCGRLRLPWNPALDPEHPTATKTVEQPAAANGGTVTYVYPNHAGELEVRQTILRVIADHLRPRGMFTSTYKRTITRWHRIPVLRLRRVGPWTSLRLDLTNALLPQVNWRNCSIGSVSFANAIFTDFADFDNATFTEEAWFFNATFTDEVRFDHATFRDNAWFNDATFTSIAIFDYATFTTIASFNKVTFTSRARFVNVVAPYIWFNGTTFADEAAFTRAALGRAAFDHVTFRGSALFARATFDRNATFVDATFTQDADFLDVTFTNEARFDRAAISGRAMFSAVTFRGDAWFNDATITGDAWFKQATFAGQHRFAGATCAGQVHGLQDGVWPGT